MRMSTLIELVDEEEREREREREKQREKISNVFADWLVDQGRKKWREKEI